MPKQEIDSSAWVALSPSTKPKNALDSLQRVDQKTLQAKMQQFSNKQVIDYYSISQMNSAAADALTIFS